MRQNLLQNSRNRRGKGKNFEDIPQGVRESKGVRVFPSVPTILLPLLEGQRKQENRTV